LIEDLRASIRALLITLEFLRDNLYEPPQLSAHTIEQETPVLARRARDLTVRRRQLPPAVRLEAYIVPATIQMSISDLRVLARAIQVELAATNSGGRAMSLEGVRTTFERITGLTGTVAWDNTITGKYLQESWQALDKLDAAVNSYLAT
jgi:hypothetical protein